MDGMEGEVSGKAYSSCRKRKFCDWMGLLSTSQWTRLNKVLKQSPEGKTNKERTLTAPILRGSHTHCSVYRIRNPT
jgi:hypothetical protein